MYQQLDVSEFTNMFDQYSRGDNFSRAGRYELYHYLEDLEDDMGKPFIVDCIGICCDYNEYAIDELQSEYSHIFDLDTLKELESEPDEMKAYILETLADHTPVIPVGDSRVIIQAF